MDEAELVKLTQHLIYGDIDDVDLTILGLDCPDDLAYQRLDCEQRVRISCAATVAAWVQKAETSNRRK